ncbi:MAG TPA: glycosyltransferase [Candidatus Paceibacterota bacterium]
MEFSFYEILGIQKAGMKERILVVFCVRFPSEIAISLFAHESAKAFAQLGLDSMVIAPRRLGRWKQKETAYRTVYLPTIDLWRVPIISKAANFVSLAVFSAFFVIWLLLFGRKDDYILSNEAIPLFFASFISKRTMYEIHIIPERHRWFYRALMHRVLLALPINEWNAKLALEHGVPRERIVISPSSVDITKFPHKDKNEARGELNLAAKRPLAVYTGHLFAWKGVDTLAKAAALVPEIDVAFVGGTERDLKRFRETYGGISNIKIIGHVTHDKVALWQAAADVLVVPNSGKEQISVRYTSPMKIYEYAASKRPILASNLPALREILTENQAYFAEPDDEKSFAFALREILNDPEKAAAKAAAAYEIAANNTWEKRSIRILERARQFSGADKR